MAVLMVEFFCLPFLPMGRTKKTKKDCKKREKVVKDVAEEVQALQAAQTRDGAERRMAARVGQCLVVTMNPGSSPPPLDSGEEALEANFSARVSPNVPRSPWNHCAWKTPSKVPFATMP